MFEILPSTLSAREPAGATVSLLSKAGGLAGLTPSTDSSLLRKYTVAIVAKHLSFMSPCLKCLGLTTNTKPNVDVSRPSRPDTVVSGPLKYLGSAGSPLMNQFN